METSATFSDEELLRRARRDPEAFCVFYDRHARRLLGWLQSETQDAGVAADLTAETFAQALRSLSRFRGDHPGSGQAWLYRIARRQLGRHRASGRLEASARRRLGMPLDYDELMEAVDSRFDAMALAPRLWEGMRRLPEEQQQAISLRVVDGLSYQQVAARRGCTAGAARTRVSRGLRSLRQQLRERTP